MRVGREPVGRWGITLLAVTGIAGLLLAWHGWAGRARAVPPSLAGRATSGGRGPGSAPSPAPAPSSAAASPAPTASRATGKAGPRLSSQPYASSAYQIWPGALSAAAKQALTGLTVTVRKQGSGVLVTAGVIGQGPGTPHLYVGGTRVYVVEVSLGDDSGNSDYSLGDDGLVVTNAQKRIVQ